jgi:hypothetical protein
MGYWLDDRGSIRDRENDEILSPHRRVQTGSGTHPAKRPGREADHAPPSSAEVKNEWNYTSIPQYVFMPWYLVEYRNNFTFTFIISN